MSALWFEVAFDEWSRQRGAILPSVVYYLHLANLHKPRKASAS